MSEPHPSADEPPSSKRGIVCTPSPRRCAPNGRRGRPSREDHVHRITSLIRADVWKLNTCTLYSAYPGVRALVAHCQREVLPTGVALKLLFDRAVADVIGVEES